MTEIGSSFTFGKVEKPSFSKRVHAPHPDCLVEYVEGGYGGTNSFERVLGYYRIFKNGLPWEDWWLAQVKTDWGKILIVFDPWEETINAEATNRLFHESCPPNHLIFEARF